MRLFGTPQSRIFKCKTLFYFYILCFVYRQTIFTCSYFFSIFCFQCKIGKSFKSLLRIISDMQFQIHFGRFFRNFVVGNQKSTSCFNIFEIGVGNVHRIVRHQPTIPINATHIGKVKIFLRFSWRINGIVAIISPNCNYIIFAPFEHGGNINN